MATTPAKATFPLILEDTYVRQDEQGRYSLNDLHQAAIDAGHDYKRCQVEHFTRSDGTQALVEELRKSGELKVDPLVSRVGRYGGSYAARELVYAYAMWISPAFHLQVIRTFDSLATGRMGSAGSNAMIGQATGLPTAQLVALQVQGWKIVDRLKAEKVPELRQDLYEQLRRVYADLGQTPPPLTAMGSEAPPQPEAATEFWAVYHALLAAGVKVNHSRNPELIAINLKQFAQVAAAHGMRVAPSPLLKQGLRESQAPRFMDVRTVNSVVVTGTIHCWVFEAVKGGAA